MISRGIKYDRLIWNKIDQWVINGVTMGAKLPSLPKFKFKRIWQHLTLWKLEEGYNEQTFKNKNHRIKQKINQNLKKYKGIS